MNLLISGITCSGKSTLSRMLKESIKDVSIIEQDSYFKDLKDIPRSKGYYLFDSPNAFNIEEFKKDINSLLTNGFIFLPNYDKKKNQRVSKDIYTLSSRLNIFEGLHTIFLLSDLPNTYKIFIEVSLEEILKRKINRDKTYGINEKEVISYFYEIVIPLYKLYIEKQRDYADQVIRNEGDILCLSKKLVKFL